MDYNCSVWGNYLNKCGKNIQLCSQRYFLGIHNKAPIDDISGDFGWKLETDQCNNYHHAEGLTG